MKLSNPMLELSGHKFAVDNEHRQIQLTMAVDELRRHVAAIYALAGLTATTDQVKDLIEFCQAVERVIG